MNGQERHFRFRDQRSVPLEARIVYRILLKGAAFIFFWLTVLGSSCTSTRGDKGSNIDGSSDVRVQQGDASTQQGDAQVQPMVEPDYSSAAADAGISRAMPCDSSSDCQGDMDCLSSGYCGVSSGDAELDYPDIQVRLSDAGLLIIPDSSAPIPDALIYLQDILEESASRREIPITDRCDYHYDCTIIPVECCFSCLPSYSELDAVNLQGAEQERERCIGTQCDDECQELDWPTLKALCMEGRCEKADVASPGISASCSTHADCRVRAADCCECGASTAPGHLIAISDDALYMDYVCSEGEICPVCEPTYPPEVLALCDNGRCTAGDPRP